MPLSPQVAILTSLEQDSLLLCAMVSRLIARHVNFTGFLENHVPEQFSPELLKYPILFLDRQALARLTSAESAQLQEYARSNIVKVYDYVGATADRGQLNAHAEILVNSALVHLERPYTMDDMPRQDADRTLDFICRKAKRYFEGQNHNEFTLHNLRGLESLISQSDEFIAILESVFSYNRGHERFFNHDQIGGWAYAYRHYQLTGRREFADAMVKLADQVIASRPRTPEGILSGSGFTDDPLALHHGEFPGYEPHCTMRRNLVYTEILHFHGALFAACAAYSGKQSYLDEALLLMRHIRDYQLDPTDGLPFHYSIGGKPGGVKWGRAAAHALWGADLMLQFHPDMSDCYRREILEFIDHIGTGLLKTQMDSGLWHNILDVSLSTPETSCTICFAAVFGRLKDEKYSSMVLKARNALLAMSWRGGIAENCAGTGLAADADYYIKRPHNYLFNALLALALNKLES